MGTNAVHTISAIEAAARKLVDLAEYPNTIDTDRYARKIREAAREVIQHANPVSRQDMTLKVVAHAIIDCTRRGRPVEDNQRSLKECLNTLVSFDEITFRHIINYRGDDSHTDYPCICRTQPNMLCFADEHEEN